MSNLNPNQFDPVKSWDERTTSALSAAEGHMPLAEAMTHIDPVFKDWDKFHRQESSYLSGLAEHIKVRGVIHPIILDEQDKIYDGHHRLAASQLAGKETIPWRRISRPDNPYTK